MITDLIEKALGQDGGSVLSGLDLTENQKTGALDTAKDSIMSTLTGAVTSGHFGDISSAISGNGASGSMVSGLVSKYSGDLISKLGISPGIAKTISEKVIPMVFSYINKNTDSSTDSADGVQEMLSGLASGGVMDKLGGMLKGNFGM